MPAQNRAHCACRWPPPRQGRWARSASYPFGAPRWGCPWRVPLASVLGCVRCGGWYVWTRSLTRPVSQTVRRSTGDSAAAPGVFCVNANTSPCGSEDATPGFRACVPVLIPPGRVGRAGLPGAFWCVLPFLWPFCPPALRGPLRAWVAPSCCCVCLRSVFFFSPLCSLPSLLSGLGCPWPWRCLPPPPPPPISFSPSCFGWCLFCAALLLCSPTPPLFFLPDFVAACLVWCLFLLALLFLFPAPSLVFCWPWPPPPPPLFFFLFPGFRRFLFSFVFVSRRRPSLLPPPLFVTSCCLFPLAVFPLLRPPHLVVCFPVPPPPPFFFPDFCAFCLGWCLFLAAFLFRTPPSFFFLPFCLPVFVSIRPPFLYPSPFPSPFFFPLPSLDRFFCFFVFGASWFGWCLFPAAFLFRSPPLPSFFWWLFFLPPPSPPFFVVSFSCFGWCFLFLPAFLFRSPPPLFISGV